MRPPRGRRLSLPNPRCLVTDTPVAVPVHPLLQARFDGRPLNVLSVDGRPAWIARELGAAIGYQHAGKRLVNRIREEWAPEFIAGHDHAFVSGADLAQLKGLVQPDVIDPRTANLLVLFEPGVFLVLAKTSKPIGRKLRRFLVDEVMPQLARTGRFSPQEEPLPTPDDVERVLVLFPELARRAPPLHVRREERLALQARTRARWVDVCDRRLQVFTLHRMVDALGDALTDGNRAAVELLAAEIATGLRVRDLLDPQPTGGIALDALRRAVAEAA